MNLQPLLASIAAQGRTEIDRVHHDADAAVHARLDAAADAAIRVEADHARLDPGVEREARRRRSTVAVEAARLRATAAELAWQAVHDEIRTRLGAARDQPHHPEVLRHLLTEALSVIPAPAAVRVHPADAEIAAALVPPLCPNATLRHDLDATGVELTDHDATVRVRCTLEDRLDATEPLLRRHLHTLLHNQRSDDADAA